MKYQDKGWLYQKYWVEGLSTCEIGNICKVHSCTIGRQLNKNNIQTRLHQGMLGKKLTEKSKRKIAKSLKGKTRTKEHCLNISKSHKGKKGSLKARENMSKGQKRYLINHPNSFKNKHHTNKSKKLISQKLKGRLAWNKGKKMQFTVWNKGMKYSDDLKMKILKATSKRPTNPENVFNEMTPKAVRYTGNRAWWRTLPNGKNKNPDFKITGQNKVIEIFGDYWHKGQNPQELIDLYKQAGLDCLVFWEHEVYNNQEQILEKVNQFIDLKGENHEIQTTSLRKK